MARGKAKVAAVQVREPQVQSVMAVKIAKPVWLHTHKAQPGDVVTLDPEFALQLIERGLADVVPD